MREKWMKYPLLWSMRSQFLTSTSNILTVRDAIVTEEIEANMFRRAPQVWVHDIWERIRSVRVQDVRHSDEQFVWIFQHILPELHSRFSAQKIKDDFQASWCHEPTTVSECIRVVLLRNSQQIEMSGLTGDPSRYLMAAIQRYNSGKVAPSTATATMASSNF
jgi:hypothetical protein